jgi:carboxylesterase
MSEVAVAMPAVKAPPVLLLDRRRCGRRVPDPRLGRDAVRPGFHAQTSQNAGLVTHSLTLPGHGTQAEDLVNVTAEDWIDAVVASTAKSATCIRACTSWACAWARCSRPSSRSAKKHAKGNLVLLAPPVCIDGWATPWYRVLRPLLYVVPGIGRTMKIEEEDPYGIKNEQLRAIVKAKFERGENFHYRWVPLECIRQVDRLRGVVMKSARDIRCPTLVVHARDDELTSLNSANFLVEQIGGARARMVVLEDSYHMVCVDNDREIVARTCWNSWRALPGATSRSPMSPRCRARTLSRRRGGDSASCQNDFAGLRELAIPDLTWVQPGANRVSGAQVGRNSLRSQEESRGRRSRFTALGSPVFNRGVALIPATRWWPQATRQRSNRRARCCWPFTPASCSRHAGSPTKSTGGRVLRRA